MKETREVVILNLDDVLPNRFQPRIKFDEKAIIELSESIKTHGVIQPIIVRRISDKYEIIAGERRYKASVMAGKKTIPAIIVDLDDKDSSEIALIENVQRQDLTPIEEAISYRKILDMGYLTQEELAKKLGVAQPTVANKIRLLNLDDDVQDALLEEKISERHARSLLKLENESMQREMLNRIINERLTVRKTDEEIEKMINGRDNNLSAFDSIENNMIPNQNNFNQSNEIINNEENPFIINNDNIINQNNIIPDQSIVSNEDSIINEEPINFVPNNIEPLNYNEQTVEENNVVEINNISVPTDDDIISNMPDQTNNINENFVNIPSMPIIEDLQEENFAQNTVVPNTFEQINTTIEPVTPIEQEQIMSFETPVQESNFVQNADNVVMNSINNEEVFSQNIENENSDSTGDDEGSELRPGRFFNILGNISDEEEINNHEEQGIEEQSISNNDSFAPNVFNQPVIEENNVIEQPVTPVESNINNVPEPINNFNYSSEPVVPVYENNAPEMLNNNVFPVQQEMQLRDVINMIRDCADNIEKNNFEIDCEEFDFDDIYQVIFKISKK